MRSGKTAILHFLAQVVRSVAGFLATFFIARFLGAAQLGIYAQVVTLLFWLKFPTDSIGPAVTKRMSEVRNDRGIFAAGLLIVVGYCSLAAIGLFIGRTYVNSYLGTNLALFLPFLLFVNSVFDTVTSGLVGIGRVAISGWLGTTEKILRLLAQLGFLIAGYAVMGLVLGYMLSLFISGLVATYLLRKNLVWPSKVSFTSITSFAQYSWLGSLRSSTLNWMDIFILGFVVSDNLIGIYQVTWTLASFLAMASSSISTTLFPKMSSLSTQAESEEIEHLLNEALVFAGIFAIPGFFGVLVVGDDLLRVYQPEFAKGAIVLTILVAARGIHTFGGQFVNTINSIDRPDLAFRINAIFIGVNLFLNITLVILVGWIGAATATLVSSCVYLIIGYIFINRELQSLEIPKKEIGLQILASCIMFVFVLGAIRNAPRGHLYTISVVLFGGAIYALALTIISKRVRKKTISIL